MRWFALLMFGAWSGAASAQVACGQNYVVQAGDTLSQIARDAYGDIAFFGEIYEANRAVIGADPSSVVVGSVLTLPCLDVTQRPNLSALLDALPQDSAPPVPADPPPGWSPMVTVGDLDALQAEGAQILDVRREADAFLPASAHVPFGLWRGPAGRAGEPPDSATVSRLVGDAGLIPSRPVIIVSANGSLQRLGDAAWVHWVLRSSGLNRVAILSGGAEALAEAGRLTRIAPAQRTPRPVALIRSDAYLATREDVERIQASGTGHLLDARPAQMVVQLTATGLGNTTIEGATRIPLMDIVARAETGEDLALEVLAIAKDLSIDWQSEEVVTFCHNGALSALNWFIAHELAGISGVRLYPQSIEGWVADGGDLGAPSIPEF